MSNKLVAIQFGTLVHIGSEPTTHLLVADKKWDSVVVDDTGVNVVRGERSFLIPKQNITCVEYGRERTESPSREVEVPTREKKQKRPNNKKAGG
tara:strand:+ start:1499 stop:1780 length:282 start_codon:yes stop_codon:yes gene_type:complete